MKHVLSFIIAALLLSVGQVANAQGAKKFSGSVQKEFAKTRSIDYSIDFSDARVGQVSYADFVKEEANAASIKRLVNALYARLCKGKRSVNKGTEERNNFALKVSVENITKDAGIRCRCTVTDKRTGETISSVVEVEDGRWNDFGTLLMENAEELAKKILKIIG